MRADVQTYFAHAHNCETVMHSLANRLLRITFSFIFDKTLRHLKRKRRPASYGERGIKI